MYLELAEGENDGNYAALAQGGGVMDAYVFIPAGFLPEFDKDTYVRADYFNKFDPTTAEALLNALASTQTVGLSAIGIGAAFGGFKLAKNLIAKRKAAVAAGTKKPIFGPGGVLQSIKDKIGKGGGISPAVDPNAAAAEAAAAAAAAQAQKDFGINVQGQVNGQQFGVNYDPAAAQNQNQSFFQKNKTPLLIGGAVLLAGGIYLATRKKKK